jgi:hypothetical protein
MSDKGKNTTAGDWAELADIPFYLANEILEDPLDENRIFFGTACGGTWSVAVPAIVPPAYAVTYDLNGGAGAAPTETDKAAGATFSAVQPTEITEPSGKKFKQWNTSSDGTGTAYAPGVTVTMPASALTLYAIWEDIPVTVYAVTYDLNGGTGATPSESNKTAGAAFAAAQPTGITAPSSKRFKQWNTNNTGTGTAYAPGATVTMPANALILYAIWEDIPVTTYAVTYDLNGGAGTAPTEPNKAADAAFAAAPPIGITAPAGKLFKQWNTSSAGTGTAYAPGATVTMPASALTLYAIWEDVPVTPPTPPKMIFITHYESNCWNWFMFIVLFGFIWMWFI